EIEHRVDTLGIFEKAREDHLLRQAGRVDQLSNPLLLASVSDQDEDQTRKPGPQSSEGVDEELDPLDRVEAADTADDDVGGAEPEALAADRRVEQGPLGVLDVDPVDENAALRRREEPECEPLEVLGAGDVDDRVAPAREPALQRPIEVLGEPGGAGGGEGGGGGGA